MEIGVSIKKRVWFSIDDTLWTSVAFPVQDSVTNSIWVKLWENLETSINDRVIYPDDFLLWK